MVYKIRKARKVGGRRYPMRKRRMGPMRPLALAPKYQKVKYFTEMFNASPLTVNGTSPAYGLKFNTRLDDCPNAPQYKALFSEYTITRFDVLIYPQTTYFNLNNTNTTTGAIPPPSITYEVNRDGAIGSPANEAQVLQTSFARRRTLSGVKPIVIKVQNCRPWLTQGEGGTATGFTTADVAGKKWIWLDTRGTAPADVVFNGVRVWLNGGATGLPVQDFELAQVYFRVYYAFKEQL